jgi:hypothetical protein
MVVSCTNLVAELLIIMLLNQQGQVIDSALLTWITP